MRLGNFITLDNPGQIRRKKWSFWTFTQVAGAQMVASKEAFWTRKITNSTASPYFHFGINHQCLSTSRPWWPTYGDDRKREDRAHFLKRLYYCCIQGRIQSASLGEAPQLTRRNTSTNPILTRTHSRARARTHTHTHTHTHTRTHARTIFYQQLGLTSICGKFNKTTVSVL